MAKYKQLINQDLRNGTLTEHQYPATKKELCTTCGKPVRRSAGNFYYRYAQYDEQGTCVYGPIHFCDYACLRPYYIAAAERIGGAKQIQARQLRVRAQRADIHAIHV